MITIRVNNRQVLRYFTGVQRRAGNMRPVFEAIQRDFRRIEKDHFDSQGRRGTGHRWPDITDKWRSWKVSRGYDPRILHQTHALVDSLTRPRARGAHFRITRTSVTMGTSIPYAAIHDPKRPIIGVRWSDEAEWADWMAVYINRGYLPGTGLL